MSILVSCECGKSFNVPDDFAGKMAKCSGCGSVLEISQISSNPASGQFGLKDLSEGLEEDRVGFEREATLTDVWKMLGKIADLLSSSSTGAGGGHPREYKVITQKDKWFSGKFDPEKVEGVLNSYAKQGWIMKGIATASVPGFGGQRDEIVIVMER